MWCIVKGWYMVWGAWLHVKRWNERLAVKARLKHGRILTSTLHHILSDVKSWTILSADACFRIITGETRLKAGRID